MSFVICKDELSERVHGITMTEALKRRICVNCKKTIRPGNSRSLNPGVIYSSAGLDEYRISGLCEYCFDEITKEEEDEDCNHGHELHSDLPF